MSGDNLTITLFLFGLAVTFGVAGMSQAGWRHRALIAGLFVVGGVFAVSGIVWPFIGDKLPQLKGGLLTVADSPIAWFCVIVLGLSAILVMDIRRVVMDFRRSKSPKAPTSPTEDATAPAPAFNPSGLYVGQILVADQQLSTDFYLEISIRAFNGSGRPISLGPIRGTPTLSIVTNGKSEPPIPLPPPRLTTDRTPTDNIRNNEEFLILLEQRMPRDLAERVSSISGPVQAQIRLVDVSIMVSPTESPLERVRLPLWSGISLNHDPQRMIVGRVVEASAHIVIGGVKSDSR